MISPLSGGGFAHAHARAGSPCSRVWPPRSCRVPPFLTTRICPLPPPGRWAAPTTINNTSNHNNNNKHSDNNTTTTTTTTTTTNNNHNNKDNNNTNLGFRVQGAWALGSTSSTVPNRGHASTTKSIITILLLLLLILLVIRTL